MAQGEYRVRGVQKHEEQNLEHHIRDSRTAGKKLSDALAQPTGLGIALIILSVLMVPLAAVSEIFLFLIGIFLLAYLKKARRAHLPMRLPFDARGQIDWNDPLPTRKKMSTARGTFFLGNEKLTMEELHASNDDMLTHFLIFGTTGAGKAQPLDAKVLTPDGWRLMGDIRPGDAVTTPDGGAAAVLSVHPQGEIPVFRIRLADGSTTRASDDHLWLVEHRGTGERVIRTTAAIRGAGIEAWRLPRLVDGKPSAQVFETIAAIEAIESAECQCLYIDHPDHLYVTDDFIVTHNTETLLSLSWNSLASGSGLVFMDPKGTNMLGLQVWTLSRMVGRDDDFLLINYSTGNRTLKRFTPERISNTSNPLSHGAADFLSDIMNSLIPTSEGENAIFSERALQLMKTLMMALVEMRDQGRLNLTVRVVRDWMTMARCIDIMNDNLLSRNTRESMRAYLGSVAGFKEGQPAEKQGEDALKQFGFAQAYFTRALSSLTDTYGHVYGTALGGEVDYPDVVFNRRILVALVPSMEKAPPELKALAKVILAAVRSALAMGLGNQFEGDYDMMIESLPSAASTPSLFIFDEYGYIATEGVAVAAAQARGLGASCVFAGQDYAGFKRGSETEAEQVLANTKLKMIMGLEDVQSTYEVVRALGDEAHVTQTGGYQIRDDDLIGSYRDNAQVNLEKRGRVSLLDLKDQIQGEFHLFHKGNMIRGQSFHANPPVKEVSMAVNRMIEIDRPSPDELSRRYGPIRDLTQAVNAFIAKGKSVADCLDKKTQEHLHWSEQADGPLGRMMDLMDVCANEKRAAPIETALVSTLMAFRHPSVADPIEVIEEERRQAEQAQQQPDEADSPNQDGDPLDQAFEAHQESADSTPADEDPADEPEKPALESLIQTDVTDEDFRRDADGRPSLLLDEDDDEEIIEEEEDEALAGSTPVITEPAPPKDTKPVPAEPKKASLPDLGEMTRARPSARDSIEKDLASRVRKSVEKLGGTSDEVAKDVKARLKDAPDYPPEPVPSRDADRYSQVLSSLDSLRSSSRKQVRIRKEDS